MKKLLSFLLVISVLVLCSFAFADSTRTEPLKTSGALIANAAISGHGIDVYRVMCNATAGTAGFALYDAEKLQATTVANCKFEIYENATGEGHYIDFGENPLKFHTGCTLVIFDGAIVLHYR